MMLDFCPWDKSALERSPDLKSWLQSTSSKSVEFLSPEGWYTRGHDHIGHYKDEKGFTRLKMKKGIFVWSPPPAAAEVAIEDLRKARLKRRDSTHLVLVPKRRCIRLAILLYPLNQLTFFGLQKCLNHSCWVLLSFLSLTDLGNY